MRGRAGHAGGRCGRAGHAGRQCKACTGQMRGARVMPEGDAGARGVQRGVSPALVNKFCVQNLLTSAPKSDAVKRGAMGLPGKKGRAASA